MDVSVLETARDAWAGAQIQTLLPPPPKLELQTRPTSAVWDSEPDFLVERAQPSAPNDGPTFV